MILEDIFLYVIGYENIWDGLWGDLFSWDGYRGYLFLDDIRFVGLERIFLYLEFLLL